MSDHVPCRRCGQMILPPEWYKPEYRWLGHPMACVGASPSPKEPE